MIKMGAKQLFEKEVGIKKRQLLKENTRLLQSGRTQEYQNNCNMIKGIELVMEKYHNFY